MTAFPLFLCLFCQVLVVTGNLLLKHAMAGIDGQERSRVQTGLWLFAGIALFSLWFFLWLDLLSKYELSQLYAFEGLAPVFLMASAWLFLGEKVPEEVARTQRLGYADGHTLLHHLEGAGHDPQSGRPYIDVAQDLGLVLSRPPEWGAGPPYREFLTDRLIIPEVRGGHPMWFIGRALEDDSSNGAMPPRPSTVRPEAKPRKRPRPKYLSLAGERPILGLDRVAGHPVAYVVEGPFDWLAAVHWGLPAFAICGTHFPPERLPAPGHSPSHTCHIAPVCLSVWDGGR